MRKYLYIYKATLMESLQYILNILLGFVSFFIILFIFFNLWDYIYSDSQNLIGGYTIKQMIWYVIITEIMWFGTRNTTLTAQVSNDIKSGAIAYGINKPYNYMFYIAARHFGEITVKFFLFTGVGILIGLLFTGRLTGFQVLYLPFIAVAVFFGILINSLIRIGISVLSFWIEDSGPFHWIYDKLIIVVGTLFQVEEFPLWIQPLIKITPIFVITYGPAKLIIDFSMEMFFNVLLVQLAYLAVTVLILTILFRRGVAKLNVNGG